MVLLHPFRKLSTFLGAYFPLNEYYASKFLGAFFLFFFSSSTFRRERALI